MRNPRRLALLLAFAAAAEEAAGPTPLQLLPGDFGPATQPCLSVAPDGTAYAVFGAPKGAVWMAALEPGKDAFSEPALVLQEPDVLIGARRGPQIAAAGKTLVVTYIARGDLLAIRSEDQGKTWKKPLRLNAKGGSAGEGLHAMAATPSGAVFVAWMDRGERTQGAGQDVAFARSADAGKTFKEAKPLYKSPSGSVCPCCKPSLAAGADGSVVAMWRNDLEGGRDMFVADFDPGKDAFVNPRQLDQETWRIQSCPMDGGGIAIAADGKPWSVWRRKRLLLAKAGGDAEVRLGQGEDACIAAGAGGTVALWVTSGAVHWKRLDPAGEAARLADPPAGVFQKSPVIAALPKGGFVAAWEERPAKGTPTVRAVRIP